MCILFSARVSVLRLRPYTYEHTHGSLGDKQPTWKILAQVMKFGQAIRKQNAGLILGNPGQL